MPLLFSYGTLRDPAVQRATFGRELGARDDRLPGYTVMMLEITDPDVLAVSGQAQHPILVETGDDADSVPGAVFEVTDDELASADGYEVDDYHRVLVSLASGVRAWVYVGSAADLAAVDPWLRPAWDRTALLVVDTQVDFIDGGASPIAGTQEVLPTISRLVATFRAAARPIVHVVRLYNGTDVDLSRRTLLDSGAPIVRPDTPGSQLAPELRLRSTPPLAPDELLAGGFQQLGPVEWAMWKPRWGAFYRTDLDGFLRRLAVTTLVVAGCNFPNCPRATIVEGSERDYRVVVAADAISGVHPWHLQEAGYIGALHAATGAIIANIRACQPAANQVE